MSNKKIKQIMEWISVRDYLPKEDESVWVYYDGCAKGCRAHLMTEEQKSWHADHTQKKCEGRWWDDSELFSPINNVTHWMPLPEHPIKKADYENN